MKVSTLIMGGLLLGHALNAQAAIIVFTDRALWEAAAGPFVTEDFNGLTPTPLSTGNNPVGLIDINIVGDPGVSRIDDGTSVFAINGTNALILEVDESGTDIGFPSADFLGAVFGFGADWQSTTNNSVLEVTIDGQLFNFSDFLDAGDGDGFLGFISDVAFTDIVFGLAGSSNEIFGLDDLSIAVSMPEPGILALMGFGVVGLGLSRRRRLLS